LAAGLNVYGFANGDPVAPVDPGIDAAILGPGIDAERRGPGGRRGNEVALVLREPGRNEAAATLTGTMLQRDELRAALADPDGPSARAGQIFLAPVFYRQ